MLYRQTISGPFKACSDLFVIYYDVFSINYAMDSLLYYTLTEYYTNKILFNDYDFYVFLAFGVAFISFT